MHYVPEVPEDLHGHKKYHDTIVNGLPCHRLKSDLVIWEERDYRITVVIHATSPVAQRKRAEDAGRLANKDTRYDFPPYDSGKALDKRDVHIFLLFFKNRIVGFLIIDRRETIWKYTWEQYKSHEELDPISHPPIWSVGLVWIHRRHRRKGLGQRLISEAMSFGGIHIDSLGWYTPFTELGEALVKKICPDFFYIAK